MVQIGVRAEILGKVLGLGPSVALHNNRVVLHVASRACCCACLPAFLLLRGPIAVPAASVAGTVCGDALHVVCLCVFVVRTEGGREGEEGKSCVTNDAAMLDIRRPQPHSRHPQPDLARREHRNVFLSMHNTLVPAFRHRDRHCGWHGRENDGAPFDFVLRKGVKNGPCSSWERPQHKQH